MITIITISIIVILIVVVICCLTTIAITICYVFLIDALFLLKQPRNFKRPWTNCIVLPLSMYGLGIRRVPYQQLVFSNPIFSVIKSLAQIRTSTIHPQSVFQNIVLESNQKFVKHTVANWRQP